MLTKEAFSGFSFGQLQDALTVLKTVENLGGSLEDFKAFIGQERADRRARYARDRVKTQLFLDNSPRCPHCGEMMIFREADEKHPEEGGDWTCPECRYGFYDERSYKQIFHDLAKED